MRESTQKFLLRSRSRRPSPGLLRLPDADGCGQGTELPFVIGVLGRFSGDSSETLPPLSERCFIEIDRDNFDAVMGRVGVGLSYPVASILRNDGTELSVDLRFQCLDDFHPMRIVEQVVPLRQLLVERKIAGPSEVESMDRTLDDQLRAIMHHEKFRRLEGSWRGLRYLVDNSETGETLKIRILDVGKKDLYRDLYRVTQPEESQFFRKVCLDEYGVPGGEPFGLLIGDYEFGHGPWEMKLLKGLAVVAARGFMPLLSASSEDLVDGWELLNVRRLPEALFAGVSHVCWRVFRQSEEARFVALTLPPVLARPPYQPDSGSADSFQFEELPASLAGERSEDLEHYCWMNPAYILGARLTEAFTRHHWCVAIEGLDGGGRVDNLPHFPVHSRYGEGPGPVAVSLSELRGIQLPGLGFSPLLYDWRGAHGVFPSARTTHEPLQGDSAEATADGVVTSGLPYIMAVSRIAQHLKIMVRDRGDIPRDADELETWFNQWLVRYVDPDPTLDTPVRYTRPLLEGKVTVEEMPGHPGNYLARAFLRPWLPGATLSQPQCVTVELEPYLAAGGRQ